MALKVTKGGLWWVSLGGFLATKARTQWHERPHNNTASNRLRKQYKKAFTLKLSYGTDAFTCTSCSLIFTTLCPVRHPQHNMGATGCFGTFEA